MPTFDAKEAETMTFNKTTSSMIIKGVFGKVPDREKICKLLVSRFNATSRNLTSLSYTDVLETMARKLVNLKYVKVSAGTTGQLKNDDITVLKEIDMN